MYAAHIHNMYYAAHNTYTYARTYEHTPKNVSTDNNMIVSSKLSKLLPKPGTHSFSLTDTHTLALTHTCTHTHTHTHILAHTTHQVHGNVRHVC